MMMLWCSAAGVECAWWWSRKNACCGVSFWQKLRFCSHMIKIFFFLLLFSVMTIILSSTFNQQSYFLNSPRRSKRVEKQFVNSAAALDSCAIVLWSIFLTSKAPTDRWHHYFIIITFIMLHGWPVLGSLLKSHHNSRRSIDHVAFVDGDRLRGSRSIKNRLIKPFFTRNLSKELK